MSRISTVLTLAVVAVFGLFLLIHTMTSAASVAFAYVDSMAAQNALEEKVMAKEREGLDALKSGNLELFGDLTAEDAVLVDAHGPASKAQVLQNVSAFKLTDYSMEGMEFRPLSAESGLISYKISEKGISHGKEFTAQAYVSSIWSERSGKWLCVFSQETAARQ
jgi:hypothetical protein